MTGVAAGSLSANSFDAVNGSQLYATNQAVAGLQGQVGTLFDLANANRKAVRDANAGAALAMAMESPQLYPGENVALAGGLGTYNGKIGGSVAMSFRLSNHGAFSAGAGITSTGKVGGRIGVRTGW